MKTLFFEIISLGSMITAQAQQKEWTIVLDQYLVMEEALVQVDLKDAKTAAFKMNEQVMALDQKNLSKTIQKEVKNLENQLSIAAKTDSINTLRELFQSISSSMIALAESNIPWDDKLYVFYCPMKKASWLDDTNAVKNPYYGKQMLTCGSVKKTIN